MRQLGDRLDTLKARIIALQRSVMIDSGALGAAAAPGRAGPHGRGAPASPASRSSTRPILPISGFGTCGPAPARATSLRGNGSIANRGRHRWRCATLSSTDGPGGDLVPPLYLDEWLRLSRAGRPFAAIVNNRPLPRNTDMISVPRVLAGSATSAQADLGAVQETDPTMGTLSVPVDRPAGARVCRATRLTGSSRAHAHANT
jgi:hypothetical protein